MHSKVVEACFDTLIFIRNRKNTDWERKDKMPEVKFYDTVDDVMACRQSVVCPDSTKPSETIMNRIMEDSIN